MEEEKKMEVDDAEVISLNDDDSNSSSSNDTSQVAEPTTPKADKSLNKSSMDKLNESTSLSASKSSHEKIDRNLKLQIKLENEKKRLEEKEKKEREKKEREEKRLKREEELKKKRQEEEELKKKRQQEREKQAQEKAEREKKLAEEKAEREKKRLEQLNAKNEEKKKKEEERKQKEEERKQKEEEKKKQEEEKKKQEEEKQKEEDEKRRKEEKIKSHFVNYFIKKDPPTLSCGGAGGEKSTTRFMPFQPKPNMYIAPLCRRQDVLAMTEEEHEEYIRTLDEALFNSENKQKNGKLYLDEIKENKHLIRKQMKSYRKNLLPAEKCASDENSNDVLEVKLCDVASIQTKFKVKFLQFDPKHYRRPPYYGTWRKKSKTVNGRRPFGKDDKHFNYEVDSDDEWEDEPADAESIADSDKGDEEDEMIDDEDDDGFFVPHGHLSDDELDEEDRLLDADTKKAREDAKNQMWETERKKGYKVMIPKSYFVPICLNSSEKMATNVKLKNDEIKFLEQYQIVPIATSLPITINNEVNNKAAAAAAGTAVSDETVPKSASKPPKASKPKQIANANQSINSQTPGSPQVLSTNVTNSPNSTPSIIKFISKVSKKNIICNLEQINPPSATSTSTTSTTTTIATTSNADTPNKLNLLNSPSQVSKIPIHAQNTPSSCQMNLSSVTPSPRVNPTNSNTAEKRSCSVSSSDSCVKRLKLDDTDRQNDSATTNSPIGTKRPNIENKTTNSPNIMSLFKKNELKKAVALNAIEKHDNTNASAAVEANPDKDAPKNSDDQNNKENTKSSLIVID